MIFSFLPVPSHWGKAAQEKENTSAMQQRKKYKNNI